MSASQDFNDKLLQLTKLAPLSAREQEIARLLITDEQHEMICTQPQDFEQPVRSLYLKLFS